MDFTIPHLCCVLISLIAGKFGVHRLLKKKSYIFISASENGVLARSTMLKSYIFANKITIWLSVLFNMSNNYFILICLRLFLLISKMSS